MHVYTGRAAVEHNSPKKLRSVYSYYSTSGRSPRGHLRIRTTRPAALHCTGRPAGSRSRSSGGVPQGNGTCTHDPGPDVGEIRYGVPAGILASMYQRTSAPEHERQDALLQIINQTETSRRFIGETASRIGGSSRVSLGRAPTSRPQSDCIIFPCSS